MTLVSRSEADELLAAIDRGWALPSRWYTDPDLYKLEVERIHRRSWHYVTHAGELANVGDQFLWQIAGVPIVLVRDRDEQIRGFVNICRHRGHPVVMEAGNRKTLQCFYHGWSYNLDGGLRRAPRSEREPDWDPAGLGLVPIQTHVWGPMVWVNVDRSAPSFDEWIAGMPELLHERGCDVERYVHGVENTWDIDANWKVFQDNTIECYHCPTTHPEFCSAVDPDPAKQQLGIGGRYWIHHALPFRKDIKLPFDFEVPGGGDHIYYYNWIFPGTYLQHYGRGFDIGTLELVDVDHIRFKHVIFVPPDTPEDTLAFDKKRLDVDPTIHQDVDICRRVQQSHDAGAAAPFKLLPDSEFLLQHYYKLVVEMVASDPS